MLAWEIDEDPSDECRGDRGVEAPSDAVPGLP